MIKLTLGLLKHWRMADAALNIVSVDLTLAEIRFNILGYLAVGEVSIIIGAILWGSTVFYLKTKYIEFFE